MIVGSDTDRHIGNPPTPTALTVSLNALKFVDSVGFADEREAPVSIKNNDFHLHLHLPIYIFMFFDFII